MTKYLFKKRNQFWKRRSNGTGHSWNKGLTKETSEGVKRISESQIREKNTNWKGDKIKSMSGLHDWIRRNKPKPKFCEICSEKSPYDLANISGKYKRDINDYKWICRKCHMKEDGRLVKLGKYIRHKLK